MTAPKCHTCNHLYESHYPTFCTTFKCDCHGFTTGEPTPTTNSALRAILHEVIDARNAFPDRALDEEPNTDALITRWFDARERFETTFTPEFILTLIDDTETP